jgi:hypothetical protein
MEISGRIALVVLVAVALPIRPLEAQNEAELHDSGLTFTIRNQKLEHGGTQAIFRAILDNKTKQDWYLRSAIVTLNATCKNGPRRLDVRLHFANPDLAGVLTAVSAGGSIKPGQNDIVESIRADPTCALDSLGPVRFKGLKPVDDSTQKSLDVDRKLHRTLDELKALQPTLDRLHQDEADRRRAFCHTVYAATANKKVSDLTVREDEDVRACQGAGYYK